MSNEVAPKQGMRRRNKVILGVVGVFVALAVIGSFVPKEPTTIGTGGNVEPSATAAALLDSTEAPSATTDATTEPSAELVTTPVPSATPTPTPKPKATARPAAITFGTLSYTASGCWRSGYRDSEGHGISGTMVDFKVTAKNTGQVKSDLLPITITTTDWFDTTPTLFKTSWGVDAFSGDAMSADIEGPAVLPGKSRTFSWSVLLQSPFDAHYTVDIGDEGHWELWTSSEVCF